MDDNTIEKVKKLLRLSQSDNPHEAALAAARAQELIDRHKLDVALLETDASKSASIPEKDIINFRSPDDVLDPGAKKADTWRWRLAAMISRHNAVEIYLLGHNRNGTYSKNIHLVGRPSDVAAVRYLFAFCVRELEKFTAAQVRGHGRSWYNNYRLGVVDGIGETLHKQRESVRKSVRDEAKVSGGAHALMRVDDALARIDGKAQETRAWVKANMKLRAGRTSSFRRDTSARAAGQKDGRSINLSSGPGLGAGNRKALKG